MKPEVGQKVFSLNIGNAARRKKQELTPCIVTKVGRKYFTTQHDDDNTGWSSVQYHLDTGYEKTNYTANNRVYLSEQEWSDEKEATKLLQHIKEVFQYGRNNKKLSLSSLREIVDVLNRRTK